MTSTFLFVGFKGYPLVQNNCLFHTLRFSPTQLPSWTTLPKFRLDHCAQLVKFYKNSIFLFHFSLHFSFVLNFHYLIKSHSNRTSLTRIRPSLEQIFLLLDEDDLRLFCITRTLYNLERFVIFLDVQVMEIHDDFPSRIGVSPKPDSGVIMSGKRGRN